MNLRNVYIVSANRTPIGSFGGSLSSLSAPSLAAECIKAGLTQSKLPPEAIQEVILGNVLSANIGQAPARQAALLAGLSEKTPCTTINKVCASGSKSVSMAFISIRSGENDIVLAGGMESMSNVPFYIENHRFGNKLGHHQLVDGLIKDGLWDVYNNIHMGNAAEKTAKELGITREEQDEYAIESYTRSAKASANGKFRTEIVPISVTKGKSVQLINEDEEFKNVQYEKLRQLKPVFQQDGTITAANASTLNDGASTLILASENAVKEYGLSPLAKIISVADAGVDPIDFSIAPAHAIQALLKKSNLSLSDIEAWELNEAFSSVAIANQRLLKINPETLNIYGGSVSLGHPIGCSGARILTTLVHQLRQEGKSLGISAICNGGGGATAIAIEAI